MQSDGFQYGIFIPDGYTSLSVFLYPHYLPLLPSLHLPFCYPPKRNRSFYFVFTYSFFDCFLLFQFLCLFLVFETGCYTKAEVGLELSCHPSWTWTYGNPPASASLMLRLQTWCTILNPLLLRICNFYKTFFKFINYSVISYVLLKFYGEKLYFSITEFLFNPSLNFFCLFFYPSTHLSGCLSHLLSVSSKLLLMHSLFHSFLKVFRHYFIDLSIFITTLICLPHPVYEDFSYMIMIFLFVPFMLRHI